MKEKVLVIHWRGPFDETELQTMEESSVLYLATGRVSKERHSKIQYCGITDQSIRYRHRQHHKLKQIIGDLQIWIGWVMNVRSTRRNLEAAESLLVYLWQPPLNQKKTVRPPPATSLLSHWFDAKWKPRDHRPMAVKDLYDVICWDWETKHWRTGQLQRWKNC